MLQISAIDILLIFIYSILLEVLMRFINKKINGDNPLLRKYFMRGFRLKLFFGILFGFFSVYLLPGDTELYYTGGLDFKKIIFQNNLRFLFSPAKEFGEFYEAGNFRQENFGYVNSDGNLMAMKFVALFSIFSFNSYIVISMMFSTFSFFGLWFMFKGFYKIYPKLLVTIFLSFFFIPSVLFWGSGVMKDTLCIGFLGIGFYNAFLFFVQKKYDIKLLFCFIISFYFLYLTKSYIAIAFGGCFVIWLILLKISGIKNPVAKIAWLSLPLLLLVLFLLFGNTEKIVSEYSIEMVAENMQTNQKNYSLSTPDDGAFIDYGEITPTLAGVLRIIPKALVASLFRPFIWEAKKVTSLIAALEGTFFFCLTLYVFLRKGFFRSFKTISKDSTILFCFIFSIVFATAIGLNCFNLGTLVRYKIPCLPFFLLSLLLILKKQNLAEEGS